MLLSVDPPKYGRDDAGHSSAIATHQPAPMTTDKPNTATCHSRRRTRTGPAQRYATANPGSTRNACIIFARNPNPSSTPAATSHRERSRSIARCTQYADAVISSTRSASGSLNRNIRADSSITHSDAGVLSTVMKLEESNEPKKKAFHDRVPACTAAA